MWRHEAHWWKQNRQQVAGTPSVGPPAWSKQGTVHMLPQWATRQRICLKGRSHSLTCSELTRVYTLANTSGPLFEAELTRDDTSYC